MNLPNKLSLLRVFIVPFCLLFIFLDVVPFNYLISLFLFIVASVTDMLDGKIARKYNLVTNFGKFIDPLADKILVCSVLICLIGTGLVHPVAVVLVIFREFAVSGVRLLAVEKGKVVAANIFGKIKTVFQIILICILLFVCQFFMSVAALVIISKILVWIMAAITLASGLIYLIQNKEVFKD